MSKFLENNFGIFLFLSLVLSLLLPQWSSFLEPLLSPILMVLLFVSFFKVDLDELFRFFKKPSIVIYLMVSFMIFVPIVVFLLFKWIYPEFAIGFLLLASLPPAMASSGLAGLLKGNISLALVLTTVGHLIAPFSILFLFYFLSGSQLDINLADLFLNLVTLIFIPLIFFFLLRKQKRLAAIINKNGGVITIFIVCLICYITVGKQAGFIMNNPKKVVFQVLALYLYFIVMHLVGYFIAFWRKPEDKIASSIAKTYGNTGLGIVLAYKFFSPEVILIMVLAEIPWSTMLGVFRYCLNFINKFKKKHHEFKIHNS